VCPRFKKKNSFLVCMRLKVPRPFHAACFHDAQLPDVFFQMVTTLLTNDV
jgi:hypothetical protein